MSEHEQELATEVLSVPLFILDDTLEQRDIEQPDAIINIQLNEHLMAELCQNPSADQRICLYISDYELEVIRSHLFAGERPDVVELHLSQGPSLSVLYTSTEDSIQFVSPELEFMPEFDLGISDEELEES